MVYLACSKGRRPPCVMLNASHKPSELLQWLCHDHDDCTISIVMVIIIIIIINTVNDMAAAVISLTSKQALQT